MKTIRLILLALCLIPFTSWAKGEESAQNYHDKYHDLNFQFYAKIDTATVELDSTHHQSQYSFIIDELWSVDLVIFSLSDDNQKATMAEYKRVQLNEGKRKIKETRKLKTGTLWIYEMSGYPQFNRLVYAFFPNKTDKFKRLEISGPSNRAGEIANIFGSFNF